MANQPFALVCLPFAGSGAGFYRPWRTQFDVEFEIVPIQLPGREEQFLDDPFTDMPEAVRELTRRVLDGTDDDTPLALFGHSFGAVLAYEIALELTRRGHPGLRHLFVSGSPGPHNGRAERASGLSDEEFLGRVQEFAGYQSEVFEDPDMREMFLPLLRADVEMHESYEPSSSEPLAIPVTSLRGCDDTLVSRTQAEEWSATTRDRFAYREIRGGHMYLIDHPDVLLQAVAAH
ncbi:thioesterase II family protein [Streptomyces celluloflavus]|uniref:thioesterase II family protein n=1 Tax=Streptomyces celluloflavus TaxID=58344 RepID=UPI0036DC33A6